MPQSVWLIFFIAICIPPLYLSSTQTCISKLSDSENNLLEMFSSATQNKTLSSEINKKFYLTRWLQAANWNMTNAFTSLSNDLIWRTEKKSDSILKEDWSDMEESYPYSLNKVDKCGRPILIIEFGNWNLRNAVITGKFQRLVKYGHKILEEEFQILNKLQNMGQNVSRSLRIFDYENYNVVQHTCSQCIQFFTDFYKLMDLHYPSQVERTILINMSPFLLRGYKYAASIKLFSDESLRRTQLFGYGRNLFAKELLNLIDSQQLPTQYGGTRNMA